MPINKNCEQELKQCSTLNEMWNVLDKYYNLDTPLGVMSGGLVRQQFIKNFDTLKTTLRIGERVNSHSTLLPKPKTK